MYKCDEADCFSACLLKGIFKCTDFCSLIFEYTDCDCVCSVCLL